MEPLQESLASLLMRVGDVENKLNVPTKQETLLGLEAESGMPDFWKNERRAKEVMREIAEIKETLGSIDALKTQIREQLDLIELATKEADSDADLEMDLKKATQKIERELAALELNMFLSGKYDKLDAILSIHAGQGGTEAMDWTAMLLRMYTRFVESKRWKWVLVEETAGEEAGLKSVSVLVSGRFAYGLLKGEAGVHRLVRQSPFNADQLRQTSFSLVEVLPTIEEPEEVELREEDIEFSAFRASGHGGQNVNKVSTAVRVKHIPTGLVVECQTQRYQEQNRKIAMQILAAKLWERKNVEHESKMKTLKGEHKVAGWGNQIRSYVLHPYHLVKDLRTDVESQDTEAVLDGELDVFIDAEVRQLSG